MHWHLGYVKTKINLKRQQWYFTKGYHFISSKDTLKRKFEPDLGT